MSGWEENSCERPTKVEENGRLVGKLGKIKSRREDNIRERPTKVEASGGLVGTQPTPI